MQALPVIDARCLGTGDATRGIGRVARELISALDRVSPSVLRVVGPPEAVSGLRCLQGIPTPCRAWGGLLSPGALKSASLVVRLAPVAPSPLDHRSIVLCHDLIPLKAMREHFPWWRRVRHPGRFFSYGYGLETLRRARLLWVTTTAVGRDLSERLGIPDDRIRVIPLAASDAFHAPSAWGPDGGAPFVLWVLGGTNENKNIPGLLRAYARGGLPELRIVGNLSARAKATVVWHARRLAAPQPRFLGGVSDADLAGLMRRAHCVVVPSLDEGYGLPVAETVAAGGRVVAHDHTALREAGGALASYVDARDPAQLHQAIARADQHPRARPLRLRRWDDVARELLEALQATSP